MSTKTHLTPPAITPGPWVILNTTTVPISVSQWNTPAKVCANVYGDATSVLANARAICALPECLAALAGLLARAEAGLVQSATHDGLGNCDAIAAARAALKQAGYRFDGEGVTA